jgi:hypothetical protein
MYYSNYYIFNIVYTMYCYYSGTSIFRAPLGPTLPVQIREVSSFRRCPQLVVPLYFAGMQILLLTRSVASLSFLSFKKSFCVRLIDEVLWYLTSSLRELNLTTHRKYLPAPSLKTLKCWTLC